MVSQRVRRDLATEQQLYVDIIYMGTIHPVIVYGSVILEDLVRQGNGTLLQYSCLENPMDGGAW